MYEAELLPNVIAMGISYDDFWSLTPRKLNVIIDGYKLKRKIDDEKQWFLGGYMFEAVSIALGNAFRKKNQKAKSYFELLDKPFFKHLPEELTEDEKQQQLDAFMASLNVMQTNFNLSHGK